MAAFSITQEALLSVSEGRTYYAVTALDNCNDANARLAAALAPKQKAWWHVW